MRSRAKIKAKIAELDQEIEKLNKGKKKINGAEPVIQQRAVLTWVVGEEWNLTEVGADGK